MYIDIRRSNVTLPSLENEDPKKMAMALFGWGLKNIYCAATPPNAIDLTLTKYTQLGLATLLNYLPLDTDVTISDDPFETLDAILSQGHRQQLEKLGFRNGVPRFPQEIAENPMDLVGGNALSGPFSHYIRQAKEGEFFANLDQSQLYPSAPLDRYIINFCFRSF